jgi:MFS family permease
VLVGLSAAAIATSLVIVLALGPGDAAWLVVASGAFGATSITIYSVAAAHANDHCPDGFVVELNAALIFFYSLGAIAAPLSAAWLIEEFGANGLWWFIAAAHLVLIVFSFYRMTRRSAGAPTTPYRYLPRTTMVMARLWKRGNGPGAASAAPSAPAEEETRP